jgi:sugar phosphate isomerase/epimerase
MSSGLTRREWMQRTTLGLGGVAAMAKWAAAEGAAPAAKPPRFSFYAMDTGLVGPDVPKMEDKVALLRKLGYVGIDYGLNPQNLPKMLELLDKCELQLCAVYTGPSLDGKPDAAFAEAIKQMKGRTTRVETAIGSSKLKPSDPEGDPQAIELLKRLSDLCADTGPVVSVYPHRGSWTERVEDGIRLAKAVGRKNVGTNFNLVHWKWVKPAKPAEEILTEALPHLMTVTINGLKGDQIVSLDEGDFDLAAFMATVKKVGYAGIVGLQGYGVPGPSEAHLGRSISKWREILKAIGE